jgi:hypothetical protein
VSVFGAVSFGAASFLVASFFIALLFADFFGFVVSVDALRVVAELGRCEVSLSASPFPNGGSLGGI